MTKLTRVSDARQYRHFELTHGAELMSNRRVTSQDVAERAGVSRTTVSYVLNNVKSANISEETCRRVLTAAEELGYVPNAAAQALAGHRTQIIGLVFSQSYPHLSSHLFLLQVLEGLMEVVQQHGLRLLLDSFEDTGAKEGYLNLAREKRIDGLIIIDPNLDNPALRTLAEEGFPLVLIGRISEANVCSIDVDNRAAARTAVAHLLSLGHTQVGCITNAPLSQMAAQERLQGYRDALEVANLPYDEKLIRYGKFTPESGYEAMTSLLDQAAHLTAVFVAADVVAFGAMRAIHDYGFRVPEDIAMVGFDDVPLAQFANPPLTTIRLPAVQYGREAGELLVELILDQAEAARQIVLDTELIIRASSVKSG
jgi:LacI family transcriptional regulator